MVQIAKELLGSVIETRIRGVVTSGRIVETEAYVGLTDRASHSYGGRRTAKNEAMYGEPGTAYIYICYGLHRMFNVVTNEKNVPDAILIRAVEPIAGIPVMLKRTGKSVADYSITRGPGNTGKALGMLKSFSGTSLRNGPVRIFSDDSFVLPDEQIGISARVGVEGAGEDALRPYRFFIKGCRYVSGRPVKPGNLLHTPDWSGKPAIPHRGMRT